MRTHVFVAIIAASLLAQPAVAGPVATLAAWGVATGTINNAENVAAGNYTPGVGFVGSHVVEDAVGTNGLVGPNYGGQRYDLEALYARQVGGKLQIAGITGALWNSRPGGVDGLGPNNANFGIGDLFIGQRAANSNDGNTFHGYGIELTGALYSIDGNGHTTGWTNKQMGSIYTVSAASGYSDGIASSRNTDPRAVPGQLTYSSAGDGANDGTPESAATLLSGWAANVQWEQFAGNRHSAFFLEVDLSAFAPLLSTTGGDLLIHWGEVCANDYLETRLQAVPEPGALTLLLAGLAGLILTRRRYVR